MIRILFSALSLTGLPVLFALWPLSPSVAAKAAPQQAVWRIVARQNAEMDALKARIETLQGRVEATNRKLAAAIAALESGR